MGRAGWLHAGKNGETGDERTDARDDRIAHRFPERRARRPSPRRRWSAAARSGWSTTSFADWPLGERAVVDDPDALGRGALHLHRRGAQLRRIARHATLGWVNWRRHTSHVVHCRSNSELEAGQMPTILLVPGLTFVLPAMRALPRRGFTREPPTQVQWREEIDAVLQRSEEAFPATSLGLLGTSLGLAIIAGQPANRVL